MWPQACPKPNGQEQALAKEADAARTRRQQREAEATLEQRVALNAAHKEAARHLKKQEVAIPWILTLLFPKSGMLEVESMASCDIP